jgi:hypothetical protein
MADSKGNEPKPGEAKPVDGKPADSKPAAAARSGAVKPPVLDLKARTAGTDNPESPPKLKPAEKPAAAAPASAGGFAYGAAIAGGLLGLAAAYGMAFFGLWPSAPVVPVAVDPRLAQFAAAIPELETVTQTTQSELATLNQRIGTLEAAPASAPSTAPAAVDLGPVQADIAAIDARLDELAAGGTTPSGELDTLRGDLAALGSRLDELAARVGTAEAGLRTLDTTVTETSATLADQPTDIGAVLQLPLILSGFETAFATGRPYETELAALRAAAPTADIPTGVANAAATGLTRPDLIARRFDEVLPAMLAGRPADPDAQWQDGALDWFAGAIALRPTGEIEGDTPEAIMSRLVGAVERRDFASAEILLASLPASMQAAAEEVPGLIAGQAEAARFLDTLRIEALSGEAAQ